MSAVPLCDRFAVIAQCLDTKDIISTFASSKIVQKLNKRSQNDHYY